MILGYKYCLYAIKMLYDVRYKYHLHTVKIHILTICCHHVNIYIY